MTAIPVVRHQRAAIDRQRAIAGIFVMLGLVDIFVFGFLADKGDAVFTFTLTGAAVSVPNLNLAPGPVSEGLGALSIVLGLLYAGLKPDEPFAAPDRSDCDARVRRGLSLLVRCRPHSVAFRVAHADHDAGFDPARPRRALRLPL